MDDFPTIFMQYQDHLVPRLDMYEQAIYVFLLRHTVLEGKREVVVGFKSARKRLGFGIGRAEPAPSEGVVYEKLRSLQTKGCVLIRASERAGTRVELIVPSEIPGLIPSPDSPEELDLEAIDFFDVPANRRRILEREHWKCFYCLANLDENNQVLEHVVSRPEGDNSYRNVVAACRRCNNRKGAVTAQDFVRGLYREGVLSGDELTQVIEKLSALTRGEIRP